MIRLTNLEFRYREGGLALRIPELAVGRGERVAVIGPSEVSAISAARVAPGAPCVASDLGGHGGRSRDATRGPAALPAR